MRTDISRQARASTRNELSLFVVIGLATVVVDFTTYRSLVAINVDPDWAKGIGFCSGTVFAYFANRRWTFKSAPSRCGNALRFGLLYAMTLAINVAANALLLNLDPLVTPAAFSVPIAFVGATGLSAVLNFVGMKYFVFRKHP